MSLLRLVAMVLVGVTAAACASVPRRSASTPRFPAYVEPTIPAGTAVTADVRDRLDVAWRWLQAGDLRRAAREYRALVTKHPGFVPAVTGVGYVALGQRDYTDATAQFAAALASAPAYLPAWVGRAEADVARGDDAAAIVALQRVIELSPAREGVAARLDLVRFRYVQTLIARGRDARAAGQLADAQRSFEEALTHSPSSTAVLAELAGVERQRGLLDRAEAHARRLVDLDAGTAEHQGMLALILEARGKTSEAITAYGRAIALDPREEWRARLAALRTTPPADTLPAAIKALGSAPTVTRADVAAFVGLKLDTLLSRAPARPPEVATDVRGHWAASWIAAVTRAGVMGVYDNHTFRPASLVRRGELAETAAALVALAAASRPADLARWRAARPRFADLPPSHVFYPPAALTVAAGVLSPDAAGRFVPTRPITGAELISAVDRIAALGQRR